LEDLMTDETTEGRQEIRGYEAVRAAAKDFETYSSDLLGDRDVRSYRQLPLEADPPRHTLFREALQPLFMSAAIEPHKAEFRDLASRLIAGISARGGGEIASELALPYVIGCLSIIYNRPQDYDEWVSWGPDVWAAEAYQRGEDTGSSIRALRERSFGEASQRSGRVLNDYLGKVFDEAQANPKVGPDETDVWDWIVQLRIQGHELSRDEMMGIGSVLLAGGRDTVIKLITGLTWHLLRTPDDRAFLQENPRAFNQTIAEMVRFLSPLAKMERVLPADRTERDADRDPSRYVLLSFVSANHDRRVWPDPDVVDIHRKRVPHLAFGFGRHSCMGMNITEHEAKAFLSVLLEEWPEWRLKQEPDIEWLTERDGDDSLQVIERFRSLEVLSGR